MVPGFQAVAWHLKRRNRKILIKSTAPLPKAKCVGKLYKLKIMKKVFFISLACIAILVNGNAQNTRIGFTAGTAIANYVAKVGGETDKAKSTVGITAGIVVEIPIAKNFSFEPAINFVQKGTKDEQSSGGLTEKVKLSINCIELPLNFIFNARGYNGNFFIGAGPSLAFAISGKWKLDDGTTTATQSLKFGNGDNDDLKRFDLGANFITGYNFNKGLQFSVNYNAGLSNLIPGGSTDGKLKSHYFGIKLGYFLKGSDKK